VAVAADGHEQQHRIGCLQLQAERGNDFQWRWYGGSTDLVGSGSAIVFTGVRPVVTAGLNRTTVPLRGTVAISGSVTPKHPGQLVYLQRYLGGGRWTNAVSARLSSTSI
jgi:serine protease